MTNHPLDDADRIAAENVCASPIPSNVPNKTVDALSLVHAELTAATELHGPMPTAHDGYAVILEELDELWDEVKKRPSVRSKQKMLAEAKQVAAMAIRFMLDVCGDVIGDRRVLQQRRHPTLGYGVCGRSETIREGRGRREGDERRKGDRRGEDKRGFCGRRNNLSLGFYKGGEDRRSVAPGRRCRQRRQSEGRW